MPTRTPSRPTALSTSLALLGLLTTGIALADATPQALPFAQDWSNTALIGASDNWSGVPGIVGYRGDNLTGATGTDPQALLTLDSVVDVNANQTDPSVFNTGGVTEFELADPTIALAGSGTADAPSIVIHLNTTGQQSIVVRYRLRDLDVSADNAIQQVALQYRVGASGAFINVPLGYVADATDGDSASRETMVNATLPADADNQGLVQVRIITTNAVGNDEWVGIDDIRVTGTPGGGVVNQPTVTSCPADSTFVLGTGGSIALSATDADSAVNGISLLAAPAGSS
jgi:uncharacterized protein